MAKITFLGAGSTIFAKNVLGDVMLVPSICDSHIALYDIDEKRLKESKAVLDNLNAGINGGRSTITAHLGMDQRREALKDAGYVINAIQVGGSEDTLKDFDISKKHGLEQTIGDTLCVAGIFRGLRTIPVLFDFAKDIEDVCPDAWFLNYANPMAILTGAMLKGTSVKTVGLCHSVQHCVPDLFKLLEIDIPVSETKWDIAGINHMAWLLEISHNGKNLYPEIKRRAAGLNARARKKGAGKHGDMVRLEMMRHFGYYITESSEHFAEYTPYWIKRQYPELIEEFNIPLDEYPRRCRQQIEDWGKQYKSLLKENISHKPSVEYGAEIIAAMETGEPARINGNIVNNGLVSNLPDEAIVEVPCLVDRNGVRGCHVGDLPLQCAALNRTNINVHLLAIEGALGGSKEAIYQAAFLDPHTSSELTLDQIRNLCDDFMDAYGEVLAEYE